MDWLDLAITGSFWTIGIILARRRHLPTRGQVIFTAVMWGGMLLGILLQKPKILGLDALPSAGFLIVLGLIILIATFFRKQFFTSQMLAGIAMLLILSTFMMTGYVVTYSIYALAGILLLASSILAFKRRTPPAD
jgi:hypothetical protein